MRRIWLRERNFIFGFGKFLLSLCLAPALVLATASPQAASAANIQVSVYNQSGLNGSGCAGENENLIAIIDAIPGYDVDGSIVDFVDGVGQTTLAAQLSASRFFFMTDMENADPTSSSFLPDSAKTAFRNWTNSGGVMVMTGTHGVKDVTFLNNIYNWNLTNQSHTTATEVTSNTSGTPFSNATSGVNLTQSNATESIGAGTVQNFKPMWVTSAGNAEVAVIQYGAGYIIYMGWDFYNSGPTCGFAADPWVTGIVPAALRYASELSQSGLDNATTTGGDLKYTFSQNGDAYYVVVPSGATAPTNSEIKAMSNYGSVTVRAQGSSAISANVERVFPVTGLTPATDYTAYIVTEYVSNSVATFSTQQVVNFSTKPGTPTVVSLTPDSGKVTAAITPFGSETNFEYSIDGGTTWVARSPASTASPWEITGLTNGTSYNFIFRSAFKTLRSEPTIGVSSTPSVAPAYLSSLTSSEGTLSPNFASGTLNYQVSVANAIETLTLTPTSSGNTITVRGQACTSGQASSAIPLAVGANQVTVSVIRAVQGAVATIYTVQVTRQAAPSSSSTYTPPPKFVAPDPVQDIQLSKSKVVGRSLVRLELPKASKESAATKVQVRLLDVTGKLIREIEIPVSQDVNKAEFELDLKFGTFEAVVVAMNTAGSSAKKYSSGQLVNLVTTSPSTSTAELGLLGGKITAPITFAADKATVSVSSRNALAKLVSKMEEKPGRFMVTGFVRSAGKGKDVEKRLATARAKEVARILRAAGASQWVQYYGFGSTGSGSKFGNSRSVEIRWIPTE